jgi:hypothetical protein
MVSSGLLVTVNYILLPTKVVTKPNINYNYEKPAHILRLYVGPCKSCSEARSRVDFERRRVNFAYARQMDLEKTLIAAAG